MRKLFLVLGLIGTLTMLNAQVVSKKGIAKDTVTGLEWQDNSDSSTVQKDWLRAKDYCENLKLSGKSDWRLPNIYELATLLNNSKDKDPNIIDGFQNVALDFYWSSTSISSVAFYVGTHGGGVTGNYVKTDSYYVRCVRGKQMNFNDLVLLNKKGRVQISKENLENISPAIQTELKGQSNTKVSHKNNNASYVKYNSYNIVSKFDNPKSYDPQNSAMVYNISCSNGKSDIVSYLYNKPQGIQYFTTGKAGMSTLDEAANYICGNR